MKRGYSGYSSPCGQLLSPSMSPEPVKKKRSASGNNKFGARGTFKCLTCRNRKAKCEYTAIHDQCLWCAQHGLPCGDKIRGEKHAIRDRRKLLGIDNLKLSKIVLELETGFPKYTPWQILEYAKDALIEAGAGPESQDGYVKRSLKPPPEMVESPRSPSPTHEGKTFFDSIGEHVPRSTPPKPNPETTARIEPLPPYPLPQYPQSRPFQEGLTYDPNAYYPVSQPISESLLPEQRLMNSIHSVLDNVHWQGNNNQSGRFVGGV